MNLHTSCHKRSQKAKRFPSLEGYELHIHLVTNIPKRPKRSHASLVTTQLSITSSYNKLIFSTSPLFSVVTGGYYHWQEVVDSVPYTTGSCKTMFPISYIVYYFANNIPCLQWKVPCVFTNDKDQSEFM